ncbi:MAG: sulfatase [Opitutales bacterium]
MSTLRWMKRTLVFLALVCVSCGLVVADDVRPNVLFIMCDDLNDWVLHPDDHPTVHVPNIDRLREKSVNFTNAHVVVPVCGPSRKVLFSGLYPHTFGSYTFGSWNQSKILKNSVPIPLHFRNHGYGAYGTGKLLHEGKGGDFYDGYGIGVDYGPWPGKTGKNKVSWVHPDLWEKYGNVRHHDLLYASLDNAPDWSENTDAKLPRTQGWFYRNGKPFRYVNEEDRDPMPDEISVEYAINILNQTHEKPFFLGVGLMRPHTPHVNPQKYFDLYPIESVTLPPVREGDLDDVAEALKKRWIRSFEKFKTINRLGGWKAWIQAYLASVSFVDDQVGALLDALENSAFAENTIIVFTSDHGYHLGEKQAMQKWHLWEESTRVPFFIYAPGFAGNGSEVDHPVTTVDLYPTLADLCGLPLDPNVDQSGLSLDGHTLRPFLENPKTKNWDGPSVAYMAVGKSMQDAKGWGIGPHQSVRSERFRYTLTANGEEELYDHYMDPQEWTNVASEPEYASAKADLREQMMKIVGEHSSATK